MVTKENTPTEKPDGASQGQPVNTGGNTSARTFRDTWQHMVDRLPQDDEDDTANEADPGQAERKPGDFEQSGTKAEDLDNQPYTGITGITFSPQYKTGSNELRSPKDIQQEIPSKENITGQTILKQQDNAATDIASEKPGNAGSSVWTNPFSGLSGSSDRNTDSESSGSPVANAGSESSGSPVENAGSDSSDTLAENSDAAPAGKFKMPSKRTLQYIAAGAAAIVLFTYLGVSFFFQKHFLFRTTINGQDFSCQTTEDAHAFFAEQADGYVLEIVESGEKTEQITGKEISMVWDDNLKLDYILDKQNAFAWPLEYFRDKSEDVIFKVSCDESALLKRVDILDAVADEPVPPQSAYPKFDGNAFVIEPEVYGTALDADELKGKVLECALNLEETLDLQDEGFYEKPPYTTESKELIQVCKKLNDLCRASITYEMDVPVVVDKTLISTWLSVDDQFNVILDENAVRNWILEFDARYDTLGATRTLTTPAGKAAEVSGGTYGWSINEHEEFAALLNSIRNGEVLTRTPSYAQTAASHAPQDWGNTFLEVDLTAQHMWYVRDGAVAFESDVVTGSVPNGTDTPPGVYTILEKLSPTVLVGNINPATGKPEYRTPVTFWMRVTYSGIGFHDATWQPAFGGDVYLWNGSHGCINMPFYGAQELYSLIEVGLPVVIHY